MISDWELWACAQQVIDTHGPEAAAFVQQRLAALAEAEDEEGIWHWFAIEDRVKALLDGKGPGQPRH